MYNSPTHGKLTKTGVKNKVSHFMHEHKKAKYRIVIGSDSQKVKKDEHDFVAALIIHRVGEGGIYFWQREIIKRKISLKEKIYLEAIKSLQTAENLVDLFRENGIAKYNIEIHVDIGANGKTRDLIGEVVGMVRSNGYDVKTKPDSFGATKVADRHA